VLHLKSLESPEPSSTPDASNDAQPQESMASAPQPQTTPSTDPLRPPEVSEDASGPAQMQEGYVWSENFTAVLEKLLSSQVLDELKRMYEEGPEPPFVSDSGWGGRQTKQEESGITEESPLETTPKGSRGRGRGAWRTW
jgi:tRNA pseudouridine13 synthase